MNRRKLMIFTRKHNVAEINKVLTKEYFALLKKYKDNPNFTSEMNLLSINSEACMELYRHSLCVALGLESNLSYKELTPVVDIFVTDLSKVIDLNQILDKSTDFKKGFLEACMHCIVMTRNQMRGV
jgi:hypothetical protein